MLLLERWADPNGGWWIEAFGRGSGDSDVVHQLLDPAEPVALAALDATEVRRKILASIMELAGAEAAPPAQGENEYFDKQLESLEWAGEPLFLMMAGLVAAEAGVNSALALSRTDLGFRVADHELGRMDRIAKEHGLEPAFLRHMVAYVTLCGGLSDTETHKAISQERDEHGYHKTERATVYRALQSALPDLEPGVGQILPDVVGEAVVLRVLEDLTPETSASTVTRAARIAGERVSSTVIRTAQDYATVSLRAPLVWLDKLVTERPADLVWLYDISNQLPERTLVLRDFAARLEESIVDLSREKWDGLRTPEAQAAVAMSLNNLAIRVSQLGKREEGLEAAQEAANLFRELAAARPGVFRPDLAMSLNNLAGRLGDLGKHDGALEAAQEAADLYRELAAARPDAFRPELATSLNNLAGHLSELGKREEGLEAAQEAADLYRELAAARPDAFRPDLAMSLSNLASHLSELGKHEEALEAAQEAVTIRRELAAARPDVFRTKLAMSLNNLANRLSDSGRDEEAETAMQEANELAEE